MSILDIIASRRSIKEFTSRPVGREEIERLLDAAVTAPNHRLTQPWRFYVLGPEARRAYGRVLGARKAARIEDPEAGRAVARKVEEAHAALPAMIVVTVVLDDDPEIREEDYAAAFMAIQ
ncbi:MAG TPA: nitroreductase family protein, partial [Longimicrobiales bacterium]|nr:nitroreductase family protein [Longimicrobiales bacterium]